MQYLSLSVHDQTQFFKNFARWRTSSCCLACVQLVPQGEGTGGNISVGSFQLTIYSQNYVVSEQLKVFFNVGGLLTIVFNVMAGTPKVSKLLFLSDKLNISLHRPFSETINKRQQIKRTRCRKYRFGEKVYKFLFLVSFCVCVCLCVLSFCHLIVTMSCAVPGIIEGPTCCSLGTTSKGVTLF